MDIFQACSNGDLDIVKKLVSEKVDVNCKNSYTSTPLLLATYKGHFEIVKFLVENGADINYKDIYGYDAIMEATQRFDMETVEYLNTQLKYQHRKNIINKLL